MTKNMYAPQHLDATQQFTSTICKLGVLLYCLFVSYCALVPFKGWIIPTYDVFDMIFYGWVTRVYVFDMVQNVLLYLPLGFFAVFSLSKKRWLVGLLWALSISLFMSSLLEYLQTYNPARVPSALDIYLNSLGGFLGGLVGLMFYHAWIKMFHWLGTEVLQPITPSHPLPLISLILILCWWAYQWYPFLPTLHPSHIEQGYALFAATWHDLSKLDTHRIISYFSQVLLLYALSLLSLRKGHFLILFLYLLMILPFKILIIGRVLSVEAVIGSLMGLLFAGGVQLFIALLFPKPSSSLSYVSPDKETN